MTHGIATGRFHLGMLPDKRWPVPLPTLHQSVLRRLKAALDPRRVRRVHTTSSSRNARPICVAAMAQVRRGALLAVARSSAQFEKGSP
jgi:hypothetical protein